MRRRGIHEIQNTNSVSHCLIYTFEIEVNLLDFNPAYPKEPKSLGERIRKTRMDRGLLIRELAAQIGVTEILNCFHSKAETVFEPIRKVGLEQKFI